jgi:hypothetical protein
VLGDDRSGRAGVRTPLRDRDDAGFDEVRPSKKRVISSTERRTYGTAPLLL